MSHDQKDSHCYDGIVENQNILPRWWLLTFILSVVFSAFYYGYYQLAHKGSIEQEYADSLKEYEQKHPAAVSADQLSDAEWMRLVKDSATLAAGQKVFTERCLVCHGDHGQGVVGPNLTDNFWIQGDGKPASIIKIVKEGVLTKGMPAWGSLLTPDEQKHVVAYVRSLRGTNPQNPKAPQGQEFPE